MRRIAQLVIFPLIMLFMAVLIFSNSSSLTAIADEIHLDSITISPTTPSVALGQTRQFTVTGNYSDGSHRNLTTSSSYTSSNISVATINMAGLATSLTLGTTTITAEYQEKYATATLTVTAPVLSSISITPTTTSLAAGLTQQYTVTGVYSDNSTQDLTSSSTYTSSNTSVATVNTSGLATAVTSGIAAITASNGGFTATSSLTVTAPVLSAISITPSNATVAAGFAQQYTVIGTYSDRSTQDLTTSSTYTSLNTSVATITTTGLATGVASGTSAITASINGFNATANLTVTPPALSNISISPATGSLAVGLTQQFSVTGTYSDNSTKDLSATSTYTSSNTLLATINASGVATGLATGNVTVTASNGGFSATANLALTPPVLKSISINPLNASIAAGLTQQFSVTGVYSDNSTQDITLSSTFTSSNTGVATINASGTATGVAVGAATVSVSNNSFTATANVTVTPPVLTSIAITPANASIAAGLTQQYIVTGTYSDNSTQNLTNSSNFISSNISAATINANGVATGVSAGGTTITANNGAFSTTANLGITPPVLTGIMISPATASVAASLTQQFTVTGTYSNNSTQDITSSSIFTSSNTGVATINANGVATGVAAGTTTITVSNGGFNATANLGVTSVVLVPVAAPQTDNTVSTSTASATAFLYMGTNPIQTGVNPGTIKSDKVAVIRGKVLDGNSIPLSGVKISILSHPEYGYTMTRTDGMFDIAVNGGGKLTINYEKTAFLPTQSQVNAPWQDFVWAEDMVMIQYDTKVTTVDLASAATIQVAQSSTITDADGTRKSTLLFNPSTSATMVMSDGTTQPLTTLNVRSTEYTVGPNGPKAMPGALPPTSGYTYAVELSADEAVASGAASIQFSQPVYNYVENFLNFPVGEPVPTGYYDKQKGIWIPSDNGLVIKILAITNGMADIDINGSGIAATTASMSAIGMNDAERVQLAVLYTAGQSLWRVSVTHFTPWDYNWPYGPPPGAVPPNLPGDNGNPGGGGPGGGAGGGGGKPGGDNGKPKNCPATASGSIIECENQILGESLPVIGTPISLNYRSNRVPGYIAARTLDIVISAASVPPGVQQIDLKITVAGQMFYQTFPPNPNQKYTFIWDGKDAYGRIVQGAQKVNYSVGYKYQPVYYSSYSSWKQSFGAISNNAATAIGARTSGASLILWQHHSSTLTGIWDTRALGMGGWTTAVHHVYDPVEQLVYLGNGNRYSPVSASIITLVAGSRSATMGYSGDGGPATQAKLSSLGGIATGPDGTIYIADLGNHRIRAVGPDGIIRTIAGNGTTQTNGDGGPATQAGLYYPIDVAVGPDGSIYAATGGYYYVRKISPDGTITTIAGSTAVGFGGDGGPATQALFNGILAIAVGPDNSVYISDWYNNRIRKIDPNGIVTTVAGTGNISYNGDDIPATKANIYVPSSLAVGPDGTLYFVDLYHHRIRAVGPDGIIHTVLGGGPTYVNKNNADGKVATQIYFGAWIRDVDVDKFGNLYVSIDDGYVICISTNGIIRIIAGNGQQAYSGDGGLATQAAINNGVSLAVSPEGFLYLSERIYGIVRKVSNVASGYDSFPSPDGSELYVFSYDGKHMRTVDAKTGVVIYNFGYDAKGKLVSVTDKNGNVTTIQRNAAGDATSITAPGGQTTTLTINANSYLTGLTNPAAETHTMTYTTDGLLTSFGDPKGNTSTMTYDGMGKLINDQNAGGGGTTLGRTELSNGYMVTLSTAMGYTTTHIEDTTSTGAQRSTVIVPDGRKTVTITNPDGTTIVTTPDNMVQATTQGPDPRFGMMVPVTASMTVTTPANLKTIMLSSRSAVLADPNNLLSLVSETNTISVNGKVTTMTYASASRQVTTTSPMGKTSVMTLDSLGQMILQQSGNLAPVSYTYDAKGRLVDMTTGSRSVVYAYNNLNQLVSVTDPSGRVTGYSYDLAGRVTQQTLPDNRVIGYSYDANGNLTGVTPPGKSTHGFTYTNVDLTSQYLPPALGTSSVSTTYAYNLDKQLTTVTRPDGQTISMGYDAGGRLSAITLPTGSISYIYNASTGNVVSVTAPNETTGYTYDGSLITSQSWTGAVNGNVGYVYNNDFKVASEAVNGANTIGYTYDNDGMLTNAGNLAITRDTQNGLLTGTTLAGITTANTYNTLGELTGYNASSTATALYDAQYTRDNLGRITQKVETINGVANIYTYSYDTAGRLITVSKNNVVTNSYTYDTNGNRLNNNASYDAQDRLLTYGGNTYTYTANGEIQSKVNASGTTQYVYDVMGNLTSVTLPNGTLIEYVIDAQNRKIGKKINGVLTQGFLYENQLNPIAELDGAGNVVSRFVYGTKPNVPDYMIKGGIMYRIISDNLGSPKLVVDATTGTIAQQMEYDEYGNVLSDSNPGFQPFGYAGGIYDKDTALVRFGARDYDAESGRWTAKDPILFNSGDVNLYGYVANNPLNMIDPNGRCGCPDGSTPKSYGERVLDNYYKTHEPLGLAYGIAMKGLMAVRYGAPAIMAEALGVEASFTSVTIIATGQTVVGVGAALSYATIAMTAAVTMGVGFEWGVGIGSMLVAAFQDGCQ